MNIFDQKLKEGGHYPLKVDGVNTLVLNMRFQCNMRCMYYYVDALSGRFNQQNYMKILEENFNPDTVKNLPCRHVVSISPDGRLFDCDFYTALDHPIRSESKSAADFNFALLNNREIATGPLCLACTAGAGATCAECCL